MSRASDTQDRINGRTYFSAKVIRQYRSDLLGRAEAGALLKYHGSFASRDILDIGVGTGRTTIYLAPLAQRYKGIDYSPVMVAHTQSAFPGVSIQIADMRDLSAYPAADFDFVLGSNNVLDAVSHADRLQTLRGIRRIMRPGGVLMFSSHNRCHEFALRGPRLDFSRNPVTQALNVAKLGKQWANRFRLRRVRRSEEQYALLTDEGHDHACLHYYIDRQAQAAQLHETGFELVETIDAEGASLAGDDFGVKSPWLLYVAKAVAAGPTPLAGRG